MHYTVYRIINKINNKTYIGKHQTDNLDDGYMGSGKLIRRAIEKYGLENFSKEILFIFETEQEMNDKEKELVFIGENSYNLCPGGQGGFGYIRDNLPNGMLGKKQTQKQRQAASEYTRNNIHKYQTQEYRDKMSKSLTGLLVGERNGFYGKTHTEETKRRMSQSRKGQIPWNKGKKQSEETKRKIRESLLKRNNMDR